MHIDSMVPRECVSLLKFFKLFIIPGLQNEKYVGMYGDTKNPTIARFMEANFGVTKINPPEAAVKQAEEHYKNNPNYPYQDFPVVRLVGRF